MADKQDELLKRIQKLVKQNTELISDNEKLKKENNELFNKLEKLKDKIEDIKKQPTEGAVPAAPKKKSERFDMVTVLFANIHGHSKIREGMDSEAIMDELDYILLRFDDILKKYNIHKIKTIGDSIMAAGGIPEKNITNPIQVAQAALDMLDFLNNWGNEKKGEKIWDIRMGIHTGPVSALITGKKKVSYDIKGDTVNIASRIEAYGEVGRVNVSVYSYELIKEFFSTEYFGKLPVKYKGSLDMFTVKGLKPEFSKDGNLLVPNEMFDVKYKLIQFTDLQEIILDKLEKELPDYLYYHNVKHTVDVVTEVELIGWAEGCSDEEILLLKTAGLFHDAGHTVGYDKHEEYGCELAGEYLPDYGYSKEQIDRICDIIMATQLPPQPRDKLQRIICDADLDYLGRSDMIPVSNTLFEELKAQEKIGTFNDWNKLQVKFLSGHQYFTKTAETLREVNKQKQIERIRELITEE